MLDDSTRDYILHYFSGFMTPEESAASMHYNIIQQFGERIKRDGVDSQPDFIRTRLSKDPAVLALLKSGIEQFRINAAERIFRDSADKMFFNNCSKCGKLARTPEAKQCRYCGHSWRKPEIRNVNVASCKAVASFKIASVQQMIDGPFYLIGDVVSGKAERSMKVNLTVLGLTIQPMITSVETMVYWGNGTPRQCIALFVTAISEEEKEFLISGSPFEQPVPVE
jgi:hypothetical protein